MKEKFERVSTTFVQDLRIADMFGQQAIKETFDNVVESWLDDVEYFTEFVVALNQLCWFHYENGRHDIGMLYSELFYKARNLGYDTYKGAELDHFYSVIE